MHVGAVMCASGLTRWCFRTTATAMFGVWVQLRPDRRDLLLTYQCCGFRSDPLPFPLFHCSDADNLVMEASWRRLCWAQFLLEKLLH